MNQNIFSHTARITAFAIGLFIPSLNFCPSATPPPIHPATSCKDLEENYEADTKRKLKLARAINETDFKSFKELMFAYFDHKDNHVDPNFAIPRKSKKKEPIIPIFRVLEANDHLHRGVQYHGNVARRLLMLQLLLGKGANFDVTNRKGQRPIDLANEAERALFEKYGTQKSDTEK
ncbi:hypothetical protein E3J61_01590 [Candidatus Dependentiae bacterium]|nr:MAG: hypothetical protein E3J61_01590 [Candidatus Dependentiae bacterium]